MSSTRPPPGTYMKASTYKYQSLGLQEIEKSLHQDFHLAIVSGRIFTIRFCEKHMFQRI